MTGAEECVYRDRERDGLIFPSYPETAAWLAPVWRTYDGDRICEEVDVTLAIFDSWKPCTVQESLVGAVDVVQQTKNSETLVEPGLVTLSF